MSYKKNFSFSWILTALICAGCANNPAFKQLGSSILGTTGLVSSSQADALFEAGTELSKAATPLTDEEEYYLGRGVSAMILSQYKPVQDAKLNAYVTKVGRTVSGFSSMPETYAGYHFLVLDTNEINAMSAPGGFIFISKGLIKLMPNEDALASVLAHEVGHVALAHGVNAISQAHLTQALMVLGKEAAASSGNVAVAQLTSAFGGSVTDVFNTLVTKGYSRSQEYDADEYAAELLRRAGYNPNAIVAMLTQVKNAEGASDKAGWLSTHPEAEDRIDEVEDAVSEASVAWQATTPGFDKRQAAEKMRTERFKSSTRAG